MRFLVLSDIHGREGVTEWANRLADEYKVDATIVLGDITNFGPASVAAIILPKLKGTVYAVPGNCDPPEEVIAEIEKHAVLLHKKKARVGGLTLIGLGGSNPTIFETPFELEEEEILSALEPLMEDGAVMVLHAPPKGINDMIPSGLHVGSDSILKLIEKYRPKVVLSGHIHEARGIVEKDGTLFLNPGAAKEGHAALLEVGDRPKARLLEGSADHK